MAILVATVVALGLVGPAGAQQSDDTLVIRALDGRDPGEVVAEFLWTGDRAQVPDLVIRENGTVVESTSPVRLDDAQDFGIVLAIDTSESMEEENAFQQAIVAAEEFVEAKEPGDQIAIVGFGSTVDVAADFTANEADLLEAIGTLGIGGGTALYDAVRESVNLFDGTDLVPNIVLLTDGRDTDSDSSEDAAASLLGQSNALLYALGIDNGGLALGPLERLAGDTGGAVLSSTDPNELTAFYSEVQERLRQQFRTTFVSETEDEGASNVTFTIGATSDEASFTPGAALSSPRQLEPVVVADNDGVSALQGPVFLWIALLLVLLAVFGVVLAIGMSIIGDRRSLDRVLQPYSDGFVAPDDEDEDRLATTAILQRAVALTGQFAERRGVLQRVEGMLERANLPLRAAEAIFFSLVAVLIVAVLAAAASGSIVIGVIVLIIAALVPPAVVFFLSDRRRAQFQEQLPDLLALLASTLRSGYSLMQGVEAAAQEVIEPTKRELQRVVTEARLGMPLEDALHNVSVRMASRDFEWAVMAIGIQRAVGGNLAELLDTVSDTMRARDRLRRDIKSLTAEGRVSAFVLGILPIAIGLVIYTLNSDYIQALFDRTLGLIMLGAAGVLMVVGFGWMYKIIDIEV